MGWYFLSCVQLLGNKTSRKGREEGEQEAARGENLCRSPWGFLHYGVGPQKLSSQSSQGTFFPRFGLAEKTFTKEETMGLGDSVLF